MSKKFSFVMPAHISFKARWMKVERSRVNQLYIGKIQDADYLGPQLTTKYRLVLHASCCLHFAVYLLSPTDC